MKTKDLISQRSGRRNRIFVAVCALGVLLGLVVLAWKPFDGADPVVVDTDSGAELSIVFAGDTYIGDAAVPAIAEHGYEWPLAAVAPLLAGDAAIVNAEAPISARTLPFTPEKPFSHNSDPKVAAALARAGFTALALANNHSMDLGPAGLEDTRRHAADAGLATFGAGPDVAEAERPLVVRGDNGSVGVVAIGKDYGPRLTAGDGRAGTLAFSSSAITRGHALAKAGGADWVVAFVNWGENYQGVLPTQRALAAQFEAAGYDLVIGVGSHTVQDVEYVNSMPVFYSLGNFVFGSPGRFTAEQEGYGLVLDTVFTDAGLSELRVNCLVTDNRRVAFQPRSCSPVDSRVVLRGLHDEIVVTGSSGRLPVP